MSTKTTRKSAAAKKKAPAKKAAAKNKKKSPAKEKAAAKKTVAKKATAKKAPAKKAAAKKTVAKKAPAKKTAAKKTVAKKAPAKKAPAKKAVAKKAPARQTPPPPPARAAVAEGSSADVSVLSALQLADSLFPSGRYTLSHGLETFVEVGKIHDAATLESVVRDYIMESLARCEAVAVAHANRATRANDISTLVDIDNLVHALRLPWEASNSSVSTGRQLIETAKRLMDSDVLNAYAAEVESGNAHGSHAVVIGIVNAEWGIDERTAVLAELYAYAAALVGAALRLMRLDHVDAQAIIRRLQSEMMDATEVALEIPIDDMQAFAPTVDIMQMQHERSKMRLFAN